MTRVRVQRAPFDAGAEINRFMAACPHSGGIATFVGQMRDFRGAERGKGETVTAMSLEYYPGMAERQLEDLIVEARRRWKLDDAMVLHRHGDLKPHEAIVLVATASAHRGEALEACAFLIDWLKTKAPFWKKETTTAGDAWVDAVDADEARAQRWDKR